MLLERELPPVVAVAVDVVVVAGVVMQLPIDEVNGQVVKLVREMNLVADDCDFVVEC